MLWYKAWLETRWRILLMFAIILFAIFEIHSRTEPSAPIAVVIRSLRGLQMVWVVSPLMLAGAGVRTDSPFRMMKGVQNSMYFTLALPVSRLKLLATRVAFGLLAISGVIVVGCSIAAVAIPGLTSQVTAAIGVEYAFTVFLCSCGAFGVSTMFATFLDQQWQMFASMFVVFGVRWLLISQTDASYDFFRAVGQASPLVRHLMPWPAISVSVGIFVTCLLAAWQIEKSRQF